MRPNRFVMMLQGALATVALVGLVLVLQASWTAAKSAWLKKPVTSIQEALPAPEKPADPRQLKMLEAPQDRI